MRNILLIGCFWMCCNSLVAQVHVVPLWHKRAVQLNEKLPLHKSSDSITINKFICYFGKLSLLHNGQVVYVDSTTYLWNLETANTIFRNIPKQLVYNELRLTIGIDSLSNSNGALSGDLDPMYGMYWSWQSGYINIKLEGTYPKLSTRNHAFQFHLGGYLSPYATCQTISFPIQPQEQITLFIHLDNVLDNEANFLDKPEIMSPGAQAVKLSKVFANSITTQP